MDGASLPNLGRIHMCMDSEVGRATILARPPPGWNRVEDT